MVVLVLQGWILISSSQQPGLAVATGFLLIASFCLLRLLAFSRTHTPAPGAIVFYAFTLTMLALVPSYHFSTGQWPWSRVLDESSVALAQIIVVLGIAAFELGYFLARYFRSTSQSARDYQLVRFPVIPIAAITLVSFTTLLVFVPVDALLGSRTSYLELVLARGLAFGLIVNSIIQVPAGLALVYTSANLSLLKRQLGRWAFPFWLVIAALSLACVNPVITARYWLGSVALGALLLAIVRYTPIHRINRRWASSVVLVLLVAYPLADVFRYVELRDFSGFSDMDAGPAALSSPDYDSFVMIAEGAQMAGTEGAAKGRQLVGALLFFVPRSVWNNKPVHTGNEVATTRHFPYHNLSAPLFVEGYVDFGFAGTLVFLCIFGVAARLSDTRFRMQIESGSIGGIGGFSIHVVALAMITSFQIYLLRGSLMNATAFLSPIIAVWLALGRFESPRHVRQRQQGRNAG